MEEALESVAEALETDPLIWILAVAGGFVGLVFAFTTKGKRVDRFIKPYYVTYKEGMGCFGRLFIILFYPLLGGGAGALAGVIIVNLLEAQ